MDRKTFSIRLNESFMKSLRHLAIDLNKPLAVLLEEAIQDLVKKYQTKPQPKKKS